MIPKNTKKKSLSRFDNRWTLAIIFFLPIGLSLFFYAKKGFNKVFQEAVAPLTISSIPEEKKFDPSPVLEEITTLTTDLRGTYGVAFYDLTNSNEFGVHEDEVFPAASLMKLPVILTLYQEAERGNIDLETQYKLLEKDKIDGAGTLQTKPAGTLYSYRKLAEFMGQFSDNTAYTVLIRILGKDKIQQTIDNLGMKKTSLSENQTSPADILLLWQSLYREKIVNSAHKEEILGFLTKTIFEDRIPAGLPEQIRVAHKVGTDLGTFSDAGIVFGDKPFVLVIMSKGAREPEAKEVIPEITEAVWNFQISLP